MKGTLALAFAGLLAIGTSADAHTRSLDRREHRQAHRIAGGVASGELTRRETARLGAEQALVRAEERRYRRNDGRLGPWERLDLQRDLGKTSRDIYRQKHDEQSR